MALAEVVWHYWIGVVLALSAIVLGAMVDDQRRVGGPAHEDIGQRDRSIAVGDVRAAIAAD